MCNKFLLVISMLIQPLAVMRIKDMITLDILKLLHSIFIRKVWGQDRRICSLILGGFKGSTVFLFSLQFSLVFGLFNAESSVRVGL